jgi:hypothetical protein
LDIPPDQRRRQKRRRLRHHLQKQPLFSQYLTAQFDVPSNDEIIVVHASDSEDDIDDHEPIIVIDVDAELGLKKEDNATSDKDTNPMDIASSSSLLEDQDDEEDRERKRPYNTRRPKRQRTTTTLSTVENERYHHQESLPDIADHVVIHTMAPQRSSKAKLVAASTTTTATTTPIAAGSSGSNTCIWYEGVLSPLALPEDVLHLTPVHQFIRQHLELFSSTSNQLHHGYGRQERGRVGMQCRHCAAAAVQHADDLSFQWPTAAKSFPSSFASVHHACAQRFQEHFLRYCPYLPSNDKAQIQALVQDSRQGKRHKPSGGSLPAPLYYHLSMLRMGVVETPQGLFFGRDLSLDPLPLETVRANLHLGGSSSSTSYETTTPSGTIIMGDGDDAANNHYLFSDNHMETRLPNGIGVASAGGSSSTAVDSTAWNEARASLGDEAERVLASCIAEADQPDKYLARSSDKALVTDYMFVTIRQLSICHALPTDLTSRGKRTKGLRLGFAGFCCRFCQDKVSNASANGSEANLAYVPSSCRSFLSAPDNMGSAISNSFVLHLSKCVNAPPSFQKAMTALKRIHQRQMVLLPYGSQRKLFHSMFDRLREVDKTVEEMQELLPKAPPVTTSLGGVTTGGTNGDSTATDTGATHGAASATIVSEALTAITPIERPANFPESDDDETKRVLENAETLFSEKKAAAAGYLLFPEERNLVSDFVFLTLMQLCPVPPTSMDRRSRRGHVTKAMGVACIHCVDCDYMVTSAGRSFPSAPDNFASAFNVSLYNHMKACTYIPDDIKRALTNLKKYHSSQCSCLPFGSQRRYFRRVFRRLQDAYSGLDPEHISKNVVGKDTLASLGFLKIESGFGQPIHMCKYCRMVPSAFRAKDAFSIDRLSIGRARAHQDNCRKDGLDLSLTVASFKSFAASIEKDPLDLIQNIALKDLICAAVARNQRLSEYLIEGILHAIKSDSKNPNDEGRSCGLWKAFATTTSFEEVSEAYRQLATSLRIESSSLADLPLLCDFLMLISPSLVIPEELEENNDAENTTDEPSDDVVETNGKPRRHVEELQHEPMEDSSSENPSFTHGTGSTS